MRHKVLVVFGTRPEAIKMAPVVMQLRKSMVCEPVVCVTAQHREMLERFRIKLDYDLGNMSTGWALYDINPGELGMSELYPRCDIR